MRSYIFRTVSFAALVTVANIANPGNALGEEPTKPAPALVEVTHSVRDDGQGQYLLEGDHLSFEVAAVGGVDVYVYVIYCDANGDMSLLLPSTAERDNFVQAGTSRIMPGAGYAFPVVAPFGAESLGVIASPEPLPELEKLFVEGHPADILDEYLQRIVELPHIGTQVSEFETRPRGEPSYDSEPELVR
jgi:hypothetical protein